MKTTKIILPWIAVTCWIAFIFANSLLPATSSVAMSSKISDSVLSRLPFLSSWLSVNLFHFLIRKAAHFLEYAVLGGLIAVAIPKHCLLNLKSLKIYTLFFLVPFIDEFIQLFVAGRSGQWSDVLIDSCGLVFGFTMIILFYRKKGTFYEK